MLWKIIEYTESDEENEFNIQMGRFIQICEEIKKWVRLVLVAMQLQKIGPHSLNQCFAGVR